MNFNFNFMQIMDAIIAGIKAMELGETVNALAEAVKKIIFSVSFWNL